MKILASLIEIVYVKSGVVRLGQEVISGRRNFFVFLPA